MDRLLIGTRFEEEELKQKQNFYNQKAVNDKGHKRFHGAFEGGFSAGYKGTVGSEEGFVPKTFTSSRQKRAGQNQAQTIQDFMDEEDLGGHVIGANLTTKDEFDSFSNTQQKLQEKQFGSNFFGNVPSELIVEQRKTVGWEILNNIQFKRKKKEQESKQKQFYIQNTNTYEEEELNIEELEKEYENRQNNFDNMENYRIKNDFQGIGYKGNSNYGQADQFAEEEFNRLMKRSYMTQEEIEEEQAKKKEQNKVYTNFRKEYNYDEDDEDDFFQDTNKKAIEYEQEEVTKNEGDSKKMIKSAYIQTVGLQNLFFKDVKPLQIDVKATKIEVPDSYNPYKKMQEYIKNGGKMIEFQKQKKKFQKLNAVQRKVILEGQQEMDKIKEQIETKKFVKAKEDVEEETEEKKNSTYQKWDQQKQQRYHNWVEEKEGKGIFIQVAQMMSYKEMKAEQKEFTKVYNEINEKTKQKTVLDKIDDLQKKIDEIKNFRTCQPWFPDKLLCKRFGVIPPYKDKEYFDKKMDEFRKLQESDNFLQTKKFVQGAPQKGSEIDPSQYGLPTEFKSNKSGQIQYKKDENDMDYDDEDKEDRNQSKDNQLYDVTKSFQEQKNMRDKQIQEDQALIEDLEKEKENKIKEKPPVQLFKSIFGDEDDDDDNEDDNQ